jgi:hypothetical protein
MTIPTNLSNANVVSGKHAARINLVGDNPYFIPVSFQADSASFTYTFPQDEKGTGWHAFTMPFQADSVYVDGIPVALDDSLKHFWIYEFVAQGDYDEVIFAPVTELRGATPYIIAADSTMAGRSIVFCAVDVPFYKSGSDKMVVSSPDFKFCGSTLTSTPKDCYLLNADGTAFQYVTTKTALSPLSSYFTTGLSDEQRPSFIQLPEIPVLQDDTDALISISSVSKNEGFIYDLSGRRINAQLKKGIYIQNGKKIMIK